MLQKSALTICALNALGIQVEIVTDVARSLLNTEAISKIQIPSSSLDVQRIALTLKCGYRHTSSSYTNQQSPANTTHMS